jgi:hypothetical protein
VENSSFPLHKILSFNCRKEATSQCKESGKGIGSKLSLPNKPWHNRNSNLNISLSKLKEIPISIGRPSVYTQVPLKTREAILEKSSMRVKNVVKPSGTEMILSESENSCEHLQCGRPSM